MTQHSLEDRFLTRPMKVGFAFYALFALTFSYFQVKGDAALYFNLLREFFGEEPDFAYAYQFGSALWNAPFFLVGKGLGVIFGLQPATFHVTFEEVAITFAANAALVADALRRLADPARARPSARAGRCSSSPLFGTPLFFAVVFDPAGKHVVDTLVLTAATYAFMRMRLAERGARRSRARRALRLVAQHPLGERAPSSARSRSCCGCAATASSSGSQPAPRSASRS